MRPATVIRRPTEPRKPASRPDQGLVVGIGVLLVAALGLWCTVGLRAAHLSRQSGGDLGFAYAAFVVVVLLASSGVAVVWLTAIICATDQPRMPTIIRRALIVAIVVAPVWGVMIASLGNRCFLRCG